MNIGVPKESARHEHRVALTPSAVKRLQQRGHTVLVEQGAGDAAHFGAREYRDAGAQVVYSREEAYRRAELLCRVGALRDEDLDLLPRGVTVCAFHHLAVARRELVRRLAELEATLIGWEVVRDGEGHLPVLVSASEIAGHQAVQVAAHYLQNEHGGRGILLGNVPGVPPPTVLILGAGSVGRVAARQALLAGAHVIVVDADLAKLRALHGELGGRVVTAVIGPAPLARYTAIADVVIGAVLIPGSKAPFVISEELVRGMKPGSVIIDLSIDQGGCVATSRPTTLDHPTFVAHGVVHYCVPSMTSNVARTASRALASAALTFVLELAESGAEVALRSDPGLAAGVYMYRGALVSGPAAETLGEPAVDLATLLGEDAP